MATMLATPSLVFIMHFEEESNLKSFDSFSFAFDLYVFSHENSKDTMRQKSIENRTDDPTKVAIARAFINLI